jgi:KDO2-lipid IV(A) lauroyltransferase
MNRNDLLYTILDKFTTLAGKIPLEQGSRIGAVVGRGLYRLDIKHRAVAINNLEHALGIERRQAEDLALEVFQNLGKILFETVWLWTQPHKTIAPHFHIEGRSNLEKASAKGRGVLVLTAHFGNWELLAYIAYMTGYPIDVIYRPLDFAPLDKLVTHKRARFGSHPIPKRRSLRPILRALKNRHLVGFLMDQSCDWYDGVVSPFFHQPVFTNKGMALVALKSKSPVVPLFLVRDGTQFTGHFLPEIELAATGDKINDIETNSARFAAVIEKFVRQYPEQWFWVHRRWKHKMYCPWPREKTLA